jgi:hypothetical protein
VSAEQQLPVLGSLVREVERDGILREDPGRPQLAAGHRVLAHVVRPLGGQLASLGELDPLLLDGRLARGSPAGELPGAARLRRGHGGQVRGIDERLREAHVGKRGLRSQHRRSRVERRGDVPGMGLRVLDPISLRAMRDALSSDQLT